MYVASMIAQMAGEEKGSGKKKGRESFFACCHARDSGAVGQRSGARFASALAVAGDAATAASQREARQKRKPTQRWRKKNPKTPQARRTWMAAALIGPVPGWHPATKAKEAGGKKCYRPNCHRSFCRIMTVGILVLK